jgi:hypothetical protein
MHQDAVTIPVQNIVIPLYEVHEINAQREASLFIRSQVSPSKLLKGLRLNFVSCEIYLRPYTYNILHRPHEAHREFTVPQGKFWYSPALQKPTTISYNCIYN